MFIFSTIKSHLKLSSVCSHVVFPLGWSSDGGVPGGSGEGVIWRDKKKLRGLRRQRASSRGRSLAGGGEGEAASLVELHVPDAAHGLDLGLEGAEVVVVPVVAALEQVLVTSVTRVLVTHPPEGDTPTVTHK